MHNRILFLDSLRGVAALIVVFHHYFVYNTEVFEGFDRHHQLLFPIAKFISDLNHLAVMFFFVLSGFVIYLATYKLDFQKRADLNYYLYKRFRRILPLYWFTLFFTLSLGLATQNTQNSSFSLFNLFGNLLFLQTSSKVGPYWFEPYGLNGPLWSLAYEMFFYLIFPFLCLLIQRTFSKFSTLINLPALLVVISFGLSILAIVGRSLFFIPYFSFLALFPVWATGYFLGYLYFNQIHKDRFMVLLSLSIAALWGVTFFIPSDTLHSIISAWVIIILPGYLFYRSLWLKRSSRPLQKAFNVFFVRIGEGSYAIYLLHYPVILLLSSQSGFTWWIQVSVIIICCYIFMQLENWINRYNYSFFKRSYV